MLFIKVLAYEFCVKLCDLENALIWFFQCL